MALRPDTKLAAAVQETAAQPLDQTVLLGLVGYNCRRAYLAITRDFDERMAWFDLRKVDFSVLSILGANPNITQKRLSKAVNVSPPNLAILLDGLEQHGLVLRQRNPLDKRSQTLVLTAAGAKLLEQAETEVGALEGDATAMLADAERAELLRLLQKIFVQDTPPPSD